MITEFIIALTIGLVEVVKRTKKIESRYLPLIAIFIAIVLSFIASLNGYYSQTILTGIMCGLVSIGLYSTQKNIRGK